MSSNANYRPSENVTGVNLVHPWLPLLDQMLSELGNLAVNQSDFNCQAGLHRILGIFLEQWIPLGFQLVSNSLFTDMGLCIKPSKL